MENTTHTGHGKGATPESHTVRGDSSPTGSHMSEAGEGAGVIPPVHPLDEVLTGDEIEALRITEEKLQKVCSRAARLMINLMFHTHIILLYM